jgi:extradiol dioxygenase family protein
MKNKITGYKFLLWSEDPDKLQNFYRDVLGLKPGTQLTLKDDYGYDLVFPDGTGIWIGKHSKVKGRNKDKFRFIITLYAEDVVSWYEKLKDRKDIKILVEPFVTPPTRNKKSKRYCFTFLDPEGNCLQFMTKK